MFSPMAYRNALIKSLRSSSTYHVPSCAARIHIPPSSQTLSNRSHQRRSSSSSSSSSSKPSNNNPPHGARVVSQRQETPSRTSDEAQCDAGKRSTTRLGRRKAREAAAEASQRGHEEFRRSLPCVPTTHHVHPKDIATSDFFSLHRPISVTSSVPTAANASSFESIFRPPSEPVNPSEVISTLSTAISTLESSPQQSHPSRSYDNATDNEFRAAIASVSTSNDGGAVNHLDGHQTDESQLFGQLLSGRYRPFVPPPVPVPSNNTSQESSASPSSAAISKKTYSTLLTILEATHPNGLKTYTARTSPIMTQDISSSPSSSDQNGNISTSTTTTPTVFLERMWLRQQQWEEYRRGRGEEEGTWEAISVKRQRRLKMKKHKYKKLMRRTRNLRRKMEKN